jgi:GST-like protein
LLDCSHSGCQVLHLAAGIPELCHTGKTVVRANPQYQGLTLHQRIQITSLDAFPITRRWPPRTPGAIQLYSLPTPNGVKVSIALEELALPHDAHLVNFATNDQLSEAFLSLNPNNKIPAVLDPGGPGGKPLPLFESGAILICLAGKAGQLLPQSNRCEILQWLMFQMGGIGPMFGQPGFFHSFAGKVVEDPRPKERCRAGSERLLKVPDTALAGRDWVAGDYSIAGIAIAPWLRSLRDLYKVADITGWDHLRYVPAYLDRFLARPAVQRGLVQPPRPA